MNAIYKYRKTFELKLNKATKHNCIYLESKTGLPIKVVSIKTSNEYGSLTEISSTPFEVSKAVAIQYPYAFSKIIWIELEHEYIDHFDLKDLISAAVSYESYVNYGKFKSIDSYINFNKYLYLDYEIENSSNFLIKSTLELDAIDKYGRLLYSAKAHIGLNDDRVLCSHSANDQYVDLDVEPDASSVQAYINGSPTKEFTITKNRVHIDIPNGYECLVSYKPAYSFNALWHPLNKNVSINGNNELKLNDKYASKIRFSVQVEIYSLEISKAISTPTIKSLTVISSNE